MEQIKQETTAAAAMQLVGDIDRSLAFQRMQFNENAASAFEAQKPARTRLLEEAIQITGKDRNSAYGNPEDNFANIAAFWNAYLTMRKNGAMLNNPITPQDVAHMMALMKLARLATNPGHHDSLVDVAGYAACGADCQEKAKGV